MRMHLRSKTRRPKTVQAEPRDKLVAFLVVTVAEPWLGQHPPPQETYLSPTDASDTLPHTLGGATVGDP